MSWKRRPGRIPRLISTTRPSTPTRAVYVVRLRLRYRRSNHRVSQVVCRLHRPASAVDLASLCSIAPSHLGARRSRHRPCMRVDLLLKRRTGEQNRAPGAPRASQWRLFAVLIDVLVVPLAGGFGAVYYRIGAAQPTSQLPAAPPGALSILPSVPSATLGTLPVSRALNYSVYSACGGVPWAACCVGYPLAQQDAWQLQPPPWSQQNHFAPERQLGK